MQRMQRKDERHEYALPQPPGHALQQREQQRGADRMNQHIDEMMPACVEPEQLKIQHVRKPGHRKPVRCVASRERPNNPAPADPVPYRRIVQQPLTVVKTEKREVVDLAINNQRGRKQKQINRAIRWPLARCPVPFHWPLAPGPWPLPLRLSALLSPSRAGAKFGSSRSASEN